MYEYFNGYIIREGTEGILSDKLHELYLSVGWTNCDLPEWQYEKYLLSMQNSSWAFTVWHNKELAAMVRVVSDKVMVASIQTLIVKEEHRKKGIGRKLVQLCLSKLPHGHWSAQTTPENYEFYKNCGFEIQEISKNTTLVFDGYLKAKLDGHRI